VRRAVKRTRNFSGDMTTSKLFPPGRGGVGGDSRFTRLTLVMTDPVTTYKEEREKTVKVIANGKLQTHFVTNESALQIPLGQHVQSVPTCSQEIDQQVLDLPVEMPHRGSSELRIPLSVK